MPLIVIILASLIAGVLDTVAGFGGVLMLLPVLVLTSGSRDAVLLSALIPLGWNFTRMVMLRQFVSWRVAAVISIGIVPGAIIGAQLLGGINPATLRIVMGITLILFGAYYVLRLYFDLPQPKPMKLWTLPLFGFISGAISSFLGAGNGPLQAWGMAAAGLGPREMAVTGGALGVVNAAARAIGYGVAGELHSGLWLPAITGLAAASIGSMFGVHLSNRTKDSTLELVIGVVILLAGVRMMM